MPDKAALILTNLVLVNGVLKTFLVGLLVIQVLGMLLLMQWLINLKKILRVKVFGEKSILK